MTYCLCYVDYFAISAYLVVDFTAGYLSFGYLTPISDFLSNNYNSN